VNKVSDEERERELANGDIWDRGEWEPDLSQIARMDGTTLLEEQREQESRKPNKFLRNLKLNLQLLYWKLRAIHRHKWITDIELQETFVSGKKVSSRFIETERFCSLCWKHQTKMIGDWVTTDLSFFEVQKRLNVSFEKKTLFTRKYLGMF
jgi:hypothetical protein